MSSLDFNKVDRVIVDLRKIRELKYQSLRRLGKLLNRKRLP
ncbi:MAG TPA: hypothetical protein VMW50_03250 [Dehalococcoidia bacterium]|nr:hypothetical protein [Dehalococcoidia bacterium]